VTGRPPAVDATAEEALAGVLRAARGSSPPDAPAALAAPSAVRRLAADLERGELALIEAARSGGASWSQVSAALGARNRQTAQKRHADLARRYPRPPSVDAPETQPAPGPPPPSRAPGSRRRARQKARTLPRVPGSSPGNCSSRWRLRPALVPGLPRPQGAGRPFRGSLTRSSPGASTSWRGHRTTPRPGPGGSWSAAGPPAWSGRPGTASAARPPGSPSTCPASRCPSREPAGSPRPGTPAPETPPLSASCAPSSASRSSRRRNRRQLPAQGRTTTPLTPAAGGRPRHDRRGNESSAHPRQRPAPAS